MLRIEIVARSEQIKKAKLDAEKAVADYKAQLDSEYTAARNKVKLHRNVQ